MVSSGASAKDNGRVYLGNIGRKIMDTSVAETGITAERSKYYAQIQSNGGNRFDTSSLMTLVDK